EDGIRDFHVTGVQTCALPIYNELQKGLLPIPALMAVGAVHQHLTHAGLRCDSNIIIETGSARDPHQIAALIGYGATAVYPYLSRSEERRVGEEGRAWCESARA